MRLSQHLAGFVLAALVVSSCGGAAGPATSPDGLTAPASSTTTSTLPTLEQPPPVVFRSAGGDLRRDPFTMCWTPPTELADDPGGFCADGVPEPSEPIAVPFNGVLPVEFPVDDWVFTATVLDGDDLAVRHLTGYRHDLIVPEDLSVDDLVVVSGTGPQGDLHVAISIAIDPAAMRLEVNNSCAWGIGFPFGVELYLLLGSVAGVSVPPDGVWRETDFPTDWDVTIWNNAGADGDDWVIRDAVARRVDAETLEVSHLGTGDPIGTFRRDPRPVEDRPACG